VLLLLFGKQVGGLSVSLAPRSRTQEEDGGTTSIDSQRVKSRSYPPPTRSLAKQFVPVAHESSHGPAGGEPGPANDAGHVECIVDRKINVGVTLIGIRLVPNIDFLFVRQSEPS